ncbi:alpha/beta hydrolase-fold protein [Corallincola platygyrae]|uniref:Alpha/beta hydrolase-fold protein n=1 Tax=Corallincola platygyrae TaxID=1193278 RepID=A0ABW4XL73_9GAMM
MMGYKLSLFLVAMMVSTWGSAEMLKEEIHLSETERYLAYLPQGYKSDTNRQWPVMLFLHGSGERGTSLRRVTMLGLPAEIERGKELPFIVIAPQLDFRTAEHWHNPTLDKILQDAEKRFRTDPKRRYITGMSMGGFGTIAMTQQYPERFAAALAIAGSNIFDFVDESMAGPICRPAQVPTWLVHGTEDGIVSYDSTKRYFEKRQACQPRAEVKLEALPVSHDAWSATYQKDDFWQWLLKYQLAEVTDKADLKNSKEPKDTV